VKKGKNSNKCLYLWLFFLKYISTEKSWLNSFFELGFNLKFGLKKNIAHGLNRGLFKTNESKPFKRFADIVKLIILA